MRELQDAKALITQLEAETLRYQECARKAEAERDGYKSDAFQLSTQLVIAQGRAEAAERAYAGEVKLQAERIKRTAEAEARATKCLGQAEVSERQAENNMGMYRGAMVDLKAAEHERDAAKRWIHEEHVRIYDEVVARAKRAERKFSEHLSAQPERDKQKYGSMMAEIERLINHNTEVWGAKLAADARVESDSHKITWMENALDASELRCKDKAERLAELEEIKFSVNRSSEGGEYWVNIEINGTSASINIGNNHGPIVTAVLDAALAIPNAKAEDIREMKRAFDPKTIMGPCARHGWNAEVPCPYCKPAEPAQAEAAKPCDLPVLAKARASYIDGNRAPWVMNCLAAAFMSRSSKATEGLR